MTDADQGNVIELRVDDIAQLFHTLDPYPFREKDLDREAEDFIVGWARELNPEGPIKIVVDFPNKESQWKAARELGEAFSRYFAGRAAGVQRDLNELFRVGRRALAIGVTILVGCFAAARFVAQLFADTPFGPLIEESFLILGWVANWRPLEIFLYDWWPLARRRDLFRRLAAVTVEARPYPAPTKADTG